MSAAVARLTIDVTLCVLTVAANGARQWIIHCKIANSSLYIFSLPSLRK